MVVGKLAEVYINAVINLDVTIIHLLDQCLVVILSEPVAPLCGFRQLNVVLIRILGNKTKVLACSCIFITKENTCLL